MRPYILVFVLLALLLAGCSAANAPVQPAETPPAAPTGTPRPATATPGPPTATATLVIQNQSSTGLGGTQQVFRRYPEQATDSIGVWADAATLPAVASMLDTIHLAVFAGPRALAIRDKRPQTFTMLTVDALKPDQAVSSAQSAIGPYDALLAEHVGTPAGPNSLGTSSKLLTSLRGLAGTRLLLASTYAWSDGAAYTQYAKDARTLLPQVDGICICDFLRSSALPLDTFKSPQDWKKDVDALDELSRTSNTIVLVATRLPKIPALNGAIGQQWFEYSLASFLLGANGARVYFSLQGDGVDVFMLNPLLMVKLGAPYGPYTVNQNVYQRQFAKGLVLVNPGSTRAGVNLGRPYVTGTGRQVTRADLPAHGGMILLSPR